MRGFRAILLCAVVLAVWATPAHAQAIGSIFGKVTDSSGAVLPGVTVTVTGPSLQQPLVATTSESGTYQFPSVPTGTFTVSFELASFKKSLRPNVVITSGFNAGVDQKLEIGQMSEEVTISAAAPVVDTKKTTTGATFTAEVLEKIPTARDPWQIINMAPGVQAGLNVGGSSSGQQVGLNSRGTSANVQWNLEGGSITDLSSNSSPSYFNFDSFSEIQVTNGGGDVTVQSSGLSINLVTKSGSNVFKGSAVGTFENDATQGQNVTKALFDAGSNGFLSGNPIKRIGVYSVEYGGPILKNKLWFWGAADKQDINAGVTNFFDATAGQFCQDLITAQRTGASALRALVTYDKLNNVQKCLSNDKTVIKDLQWKFNYQLNASNKFQYLFQSDNKYRNARGANATTLKEATTQQTSDKPWGLPLPTHSITHTFIASDKLVFNNQFTYVHGGFFLDYQDVPPQGACAQSAYTGSDQVYTGRDAGCLWNIQSLNNRTTSVNSRSLTTNYQTTRHSWEAKTDGTYFLTHTLGGDHSLKFGLGWRRNPIQTFSHYSGGARAFVQCVGNTNANCGDGGNVAVGSTTGIVPFQADVYRDQLLNNDWWSYNGYLQDSFSRGRWRLNGGLRYDWQQSKYLGGCVPANVLVPTLLPSQCEGATMADSSNGKKIQSFGNWSPRLAATYDLFGNGKTQIHASGSYFYNTKITLANSLSGLFTQTRLRWGPNLSSGACNTASSGCWTDANHDGAVQTNELTGSPTSSSDRFVNGVLLPAGNIVDPSAKIGRTREALVGMQHELIANLAVGVDFIYRKYDRGTTTYTVGFQPGAGYDALRGLYQPAPYTDPLTGLTATYYFVCATCSRPSGLGNVTLTNPNYQTYKGIDLTATKRYSNRWQMAVAVTLQDNPNFFPNGTAQFVNPTGLEFQDGYSTISRFLVKAQGSYTFPWDINVSANFNWNDGAAGHPTPASSTAVSVINGPGSVPGGTTGTLSYTTLEFKPRGEERLEAVKLLDMGVQKAFKLRGGRNRLKLMVDGFNMFNANTIQSYASNLLSASNYLAPASIVPPRVFRFGASIAF
ncbi:MAG TPA: carboxypeptidase regulatory-like domain-containing protein [Vicinamibacterales bacterium]|nr:carboxypeptidase regulatory-like domain-containing protein [Vicinamibacterales bacterium]